MKQIIGNLSIKSRATLLLVTVTLLSSVIIGALGWRSGRVALESAIVNQLSAVRLSKAMQIEDYFSQIFSHASTLAESRMVVNAVKQFQEGFNVGLNRTLSAEQHAEVTKFYNNEFIPLLNRSTESDVLPVIYRPRREITNYFQYHYIVDNPYRIGSKVGLVESEQDSTFYNRFHKVYHPILRNLKTEFDYYDLFLIDTESLNIVYSVAKETDFATNLVDGPYSESALGVLARKIKEQPERGLVRIADYRPYAPSFGAPAAFVGAPVFDGNEAIGILAIQLPVDKINEVMTSKSEWKNHGLGKTGESVLVGPDQFLRSASRYLIDDRSGYLASLREVGVSSQTIDNIETHKTSILFQPVVSASVSSALEGNSGTQMATNYLGHSVLSSYGPLKIEGLNWIILSEMSENEAFQPIRSLLRHILVWGVVLVLSVAFLAMILARLFVRPIEKLTRGVHALASGDTDAHIDLHSKDEFGDLADSFNIMSETIDRKSSENEKLRIENQRFLQNILPLPIVERVKNGEHVADHLQQVSVVWLKVKGFNEYSAKVGAAEAAHQLSTLYERLDETAQRFDVETFKTIGTTYLGTCGTSSTRLDHSKRILEFAITAKSTVQSLSTELATNLSLNARIDSGSVSAAVIGSSRFSYELWGQPLDTVQASVDSASGNDITVSERTYERLSSFYSFTSTPTTSGEDTFRYILDEDSIDLVKKPDVTMEAL